MCVCVCVNNTTRLLQSLVTWNVCLRRACEREQASDGCVFACTFYSSKQRDSMTLRIFCGTLTERGEQLSPDPVSFGKRLRYGTVRERGEGDVTFVFFLRFLPSRMFGRFGWTEFTPGWVDLCQHTLCLFIWPWWRPLVRYRVGHQERFQGKTGENQG